MQEDHVCDAPFEMLLICDADVMLVMLKEYIESGWHYLRLLRFMKHHQRDLTRIKKLSFSEENERKGGKEMHT